MFFVNSQDIAQEGLVFFSPSLFSSYINCTVHTADQNNVICVKVHSSCNTYGKPRVHNFQMKDNPGEEILYGGSSHWQVFDMEHSSCHPLGT